MADHVGPYELFEKLGAGGMGTTYRASDTRTGQVVALKILHPHLADEPDAVGRLQREAQIAGQLDDPRIVRVLDSGSAGDQHYVVLEYVEGETVLQVLLREGRLSEAETGAIVLDVARALEAAQARGVVHRDIKPSNILLPRGGGVRVTDFGLARAPGMSTMTETGAFVGTPVYAAPEAWHGTADQRADLYSLGLVAYHALLGVVPAGTDASKRRPSPVRVNASALARVAPRLRPIISRLLEENPARRYQSPSDLVHDLEALPPLEAVPVELDGATMPIPRPTFQRRAITPLPLQSTWWSMSRGARVGSLAAVTAIAVAMIAGAALLLGGGGGDVPDPPPAIITDRTWEVWLSNWKTLTEDEFPDRDKFLAARGGRVPGGPQIVCLRGEEECHGEDTPWRYAGNDVEWQTIDGAEWIWAAGLERTDLAGDAAYFFEKRDIPFDGKAIKEHYDILFTYAFDNGIRTFIDGNEFRAGPNVDPGTVVENYPISDLVEDGDTHTIIFWGVNAPCETTCTYQQEPAGLAARIDFVPKAD